MIKINGAFFGSEHFGNGEVIFKEVELKDNTNEIELWFESNEDIANLMFAAEYIKDEKPKSVVGLFMPYIPYSGMDRKINEQLFSLKLLASIIEKSGISYIKSLDVHNMDVASELFGCKLYFLDVDKYVKKAIEDFKPDIIHFPDAGAYKKYPKIINVGGIHCTYGIKKRDLNNKGKIVSYEIETSGEDLNGKRVLIVDDICRRGGTFVNAAKHLVGKGVSEVALYVSHCEEGIFSGDVLGDENIKCVYTTNSQPKFMENKARLNLYTTIGAIKVFEVESK